MRPVFANSAFVTAPERLILRGGAWRRVRLRVRYGIFQHREFGPVLIDTGYGPAATLGDGRSRALKLYSRMLAPELVDEGQPDAVLQRMGLCVDDVRRVIITHFHADHVANLGLFPKAQFIGHGQAHKHIRENSEQMNLRHGVFAELLPPDFDDRFVAIESLPSLPLPAGLAGGGDLLGDGSALAVDLPGHAEGHFGVLFTGLKPLLYAVDAQWLMAGIEPGRAPGLPASLIAHNASAIASTNAALRQFIGEGGEVMLCHDPALTAHDFEAGR